MSNKYILKFGTGNIIVTANINTLIFKEIDAKIELGTLVELKNYDNAILLKNVTTLSLKEYSEINEFKKLLNQAYENKTFEFKNIIFDFSDYSRKSVDCILDQIAWIEQFIPKPYAI